MFGETNGDTVVSSPYLASKRQGQEGMPIIYRKCKPNFWQVELVIGQKRVRMTADEAAFIVDKESPEKMAKRQMFGNI